MANLIAPCSPYITHDYLANCCKEVQDESDAEDTLLARQIASSILFYATGQQFQGQCDAFIRPSYKCSPCPDGRPFEPIFTDGHWLNLPCGTGCGCDTHPYVDLSHWDVDTVVAVYVDGLLVSPTDYNVVGSRIYFLENIFPICQDWTQPAFPDEDESDFSGFEGTWGIHIVQGTMPPPLVQQATAELACHYQNLCDNDCNTCRYAMGLSGAETIDYALNEILPWVYTGIPTVDTVVRILNPNGNAKVQARIWSPEAPREAYYGG